MAEFQQQLLYKLILSRYPMFPCFEQKLKWDYYGEIVRPEEWADAKPDDEKVNWCFHNHDKLQSSSLTYKNLVSIQLSCKLIQCLAANLI